MKKFNEFVNFGIDLEITTNYNGHVMSNKTGLTNLGKGLAGAIAIASGTSAYGTIITVSTPADLTNSPGGANTTVNWDVNGDAINDFTFSIAIRTRRRDFTALFGN